MSSATEIRLLLAPTRRFEMLDIGARIAREAGDVLRRYQKALYCSMHSTAGYLDVSLAARLLHRHERLAKFVGAFRTVFPSDAAYRHDQIHLRDELSEDQKRTEPRNADSHLTFIGARLRNLVTYRNDPAVPVFFIELDGTNGELRRQRETAVVGYDSETLVERLGLAVPVSCHPVDSVNLADPRLGLVEQVNERLARLGLAKARVDIALEPEERNASVAVNEYETLLMRHDLVEVLKDPLRFAVSQSRRALDDPLSLPGKTLSYARYDVVRVMNLLIEALRVEHSVLERLAAKVMALPARHLLRSRRASFLASERENGGVARLVKGTYQSPILIQWKGPERQTRRLTVEIVSLD